MGQKISPTALRLQTNKNFTASWYTNKLYSQTLHNQLQLQTFFDQVFAQVGTKATQTYCQKFPATSKVHTFFCSPRIFDERLTKKMMNLEPTLFFQTITSQRWPFLPNQLKWDKFLKKTIFQSFIEEKSGSQNPIFFQNFNGQKSNVINHVKFYMNHIESLAGKYSNTKMVWLPVKVNSLTKSAKFLSESIARSLEQQKPVKQIFRTVQTLLKKDPTVEGFKISCSGRLQGVEMAKTEVTKFGKISLHVFSSKVDYAEAKASTNFGILGVKVWICYRS